MHSADSFQKRNPVSYFSEEMFVLEKLFLFIATILTYLFLNRFVVCLTIECQIFDLLNHLQHFMFISGKCGLGPPYTALKAKKNCTSIPMFFRNRKKTQMKRVHAYIGERN